MASDYYAVLDVAADASREEIKRAWRRRVRETHPDQGGKAEDFHAVQEAWETLGDESKRAAYDRARTRTFTANDPSYFSYGTNLRTDPFTEEMSNRIKTEATRLFEEVQRRQREAAAKEKEIQSLGNPTFPLYNSSLGTRINRLYIEGTLWGIPLKKLQQWKTRDAIGISVFLIAAILINALVIVLAAAHSTATNIFMHVSVTVMYTAFLDLVAIFLAFITGLGLAFYRFTKHALRRNKTVNFRL